MERAGGLFSKSAGFVVPIHAFWSTAARCATSGAIAAALHRADGALGLLERRAQGLYRGRGRAALAGAWCRARARYRGLITSSKLAVRGHSGPTQRRSSLGCAHSRCVPLFAVSWEQAQAARLGLSSPPSSTPSPPREMHWAVRSAVNWTAMRKSRRLTGALTAGEGGETVVEGGVLGLGGTVAIVPALGGMAAIVLRLRETAAITDLPSPSWPAICTTTPLALAIDPHTRSAHERGRSGR